MTEGGGVRQAMLLAAGTRLRPGAGRRLAVHELVGDRPLLDRLIMELAAFGIREVLLLAPTQDADAFRRLDGAILGGAGVRVIANDLAGAPDLLDERFLLVEAGAIVCDLAPFLGQTLTPGAARLLVRDGTPVGVALGGPASFRAALRGEGEAWACTGEVIDFAVAEGDTAALRRLEDLLRRPAAFLDRDGVINVDAGFTFEPEKLVFTPTAVEAIRALNRARYRVIVVTNQSGVARGYYGIADVERFHLHLQDRLLAAGAHVDAFYACPYHPDGTVPAFAMEHEDRKPSPGMLRRAMRDWAIPAEGSFMVGDKASDVEVAKRAGVPGLRVQANVCDLAAEIATFRSRIDADARPAEPVRLQ